MVAIAENKLSLADLVDASNRRMRKTVNNGGLTGDIPDGTADCCWLGWQCVEERNPFGGSGSTDTPIRQYIWGTYIDECIQMTTYTILGPQSLPAGAYYLLQDLLYRAVALTNSSGGIVEAYDTDAYGNTLIFTGPGPDGTWFTDDDTQSSYGANDTIYCGYRYDAERKNYYVRNRYYSPTLGRWLSRDPIGYRGGINLYAYVASNPVGNLDAKGEVGGFWGGVLDFLFPAGTSWGYMGMGGTIGPSPLPTPPTPPPAPGLYVYNVESWGALGLHQVVAVVGPSGDSSAYSFDFAGGWGLFGPGIVMADNGDTYWGTYEKFLFAPWLAAQASAELKRYLLSINGEKGYYNVLSHNCRDFAQGEFNKLKDMYDQLLAHALNQAQHHILKPFIPAVPSPGNPVLHLGSAFVVDWRKACGC